MSEQKNLDHKLKNEKLSFTQQRRVILEEVEKKDCHLTADEIYFLVKKRMPKVSVGTIYRNLSVLVDLNLIDKVKTSLHDESYYEIHRDPHYHIICTRCLRIDDLEHYRALSIEPTAEKISNYTISHHLIELHGICPNCRNKNTSTEISDTKNESSDQRVASQDKVLENKAITKNQETSIFKKIEEQMTTESVQEDSKNFQRRKFFFGRRNLS